FFFSLGLLLATLSWRRPGQLWRACCAGAAFVLATLTYEAPLVLLVGTSMLAALTLRGVRRRLLMAIALGPVVVWSALNALVLAMTGGHTYQATMSITLDAGHLVKQITDGLSVLLVDAWLTPFDLLRSGVVPNDGYVRFGVASFALCLTPFLLGSSSLPDRRTCRKLLGLAAAWSVLSLAVFAAVNIPMSQPDRTQSFSLIGGAMLFTSAVGWTLSFLPYRRAMQVVFLLACVAPTVLFFAMASVYQRNYSQAWDEQRATLKAVVEQAPNIPDGSLILISGLPDTRIVFVGGYTCEFALGYLEDRPHVPAMLRYTAQSAEEVVAKRINCGLLFNGRDLDFQ